MDVCVSVEYKDFKTIKMATFKTNKQTKKITPIGKDKEKLELLYTVSGM